MEGSVYSAPDGSFAKTVNRGGSGLERPNEGASCHIQIEARTEDGNATYGYPTNVETRIVLGNGIGDLSRTVDGVLETMGKGETCSVKISPELLALVRTRKISETKSDNESKTKDADYSSFEISLFDFERSKEVYQLSLKEKVERMRNYKSFGSECFKDGRFDLAESFYIRGLKYGVISERYIGDDEFPEVIEKFWDLKKLCLLNLAACQLKVGRQGDVITNCTTAIGIDDLSVKGYFRRGLAYMAKQDYELALADFEKGLELEPKNRQLHEQIKILKARMKSLDDKYATSMKKLFD